jgi:hypothetical protein
MCWIISKNASARSDNLVPEHGGEKEHKGHGEGRPDAVPRHSRGATRP